MTEAISTHQFNRPRSSSVALHNRRLLEVPPNGQILSKEQNLTPYEQLLYQSEHDARFKDEAKVGKRIGFYRLEGNIGLGNFSRVKLGSHLLAKEKVAVKILDKTKLEPKTQRLLLREISSLECLHHPNIIRLYEVIETSKQYFMITEYAEGGDLYTRITSNGKFKENDAKYYFAQLTAAVEHMHRKGIVHRDIKCENVFFVNDRLIKLGDFGFSTYSEKEKLLDTFCGSPPYAAPELYRDEQYVGFYVDIWSLGVLLYFLVTGLMPFRAENVTKLKKSVLNGEYIIPPHVSNDCQELIHNLLDQEPAERWTCEEIRSCSWLKNENFPSELKPLPQILTNFWTSTDKEESTSTILSKAPPTLPPRSSYEYEAHLHLEELGITPELLQKATKTSHEKLLSNRDSINGTYRILLHRLEKQSNPLEHDEQYNQKVKDKKTSNVIRRRASEATLPKSKKKNEQNSHLCTIF